MASDPAAPQRISISLDVLRTEIRLANAELELRLMDKLATKSDFAILETRIKKLEQSESEYLALLPLREVLIAEHARMKGEIESLEADKIGQDAVDRFKNRIIGGSIVAAMVLIANLSINLYQIFMAQG